MSKLLRIVALAAALAAGSMQNYAEATIAGDAAGIRAAIEDLVTTGLIHCLPGRKHSHGGMAYISDGCTYRLAPGGIKPNTRVRWPLEGKPNVVRVPRSTCHVFRQSSMRPC
jgi:hypothetical protein